MVNKRYYAYLKGLFEQIVQGDDAQIEYIISWLKIGIEAAAEEEKRRSKTNLN